ncbi:hypothetical protein CLOP_g21414 [Closterium sp. NIES-67]|nr:hypothetical protein CLOP_g21414 [Closterium sp. NIES-67]
MPKKLAPNTKAEEARERKAAAADDKKRAAEKAKEDARWADDAPKGRAAKKKEEDEQKRVEAAAKRAEKKRLEELEAKEMAKISGKGVSGGGGGGGGAGAGARRAGAGSSSGGGSAKVTQAELARIKEREQQELAGAEAERRKKAARVAEEAEYARILEVENTNRMAVAVDARNVGEALSQLSVAAGDEGSSSVDKHPEKRMKAAFKAFEESELPRLKQERPGLTLTQYKEQIWKQWKKSPQNPMNQQ